MFETSERSFSAKVVIGFIVVVLGLFAILFGQTQQAHAETFVPATISSKQAAPSGIAYVRVGNTIIYENKAITHAADDGFTPRIPAGTKAGSVKGVSYNAATNTLTLSKYSAKALKLYAPWSFTSGDGLKSHIFIAGTFDGKASVTVVLKGTNYLKNTYRSRSVDKPYFIGAEKCNVTLKGTGTLKTEKCNGVKTEGKIVVKSGTYRINKCGTWGGGFCTEDSTITFAKAAKLYLVGADKEGGDQVIRAEKCTNNTASLKKIWGTLCYGAKFKAVRQFDDGSKLNLGTYQVNSKANQSYSITLLKSALTGTLGFDYISRLSYSTYTPYITGISSGALNMGAKSKHIDTVILGERVNIIGKQAFKPAKKLKHLFIRCGSNSKLLYSKNGLFESRDCEAVNSKAFSGLSKKCTVTINYYNKKKVSKSTIATQCKKLLMKYGLSKSIKVKVNYGYYSYV